MRVITQKHVTLNACAKCQVAKWSCNWISCTANCHCDDDNNSKSRYTCPFEFYIHSYWRYMALEIFTNWTELVLLCNTWSNPAHEKYQYVSHYFYIYRFVFKLFLKLGITNIRDMSIKKNAIKKVGSPEVAVRPKTQRALNVSRRPCSESQLTKVMLNKYKPENQSKLLELQQMPVSTATLL